MVTTAVNKWQPSWLLHCKGIRDSNRASKPTSRISKMPNYKIQMPNQCQISNVRFLKLRHSLPAQRSGGPGREILKFLPLVEMTGKLYPSLERNCECLITPPRPLALRFRPWRGAFSSLAKKLPFLALRLWHSFDICHWAFGINRKATKPWESFGTHYTKGNFAGLDKRGMAASCARHGVVVVGWKGLTLPRWILQGGCSLKMRQRSGFALVFAKKRWNQPQGRHGSDSKKVRNMPCWIL